ncbi:hypothetical protein ACQPZG_30590 [Streptomyces sp. CA-294286]|uniref:hypothetical protein n=1 Tax=Streptomyces sp. CA-294286 TaxID=3240070 RepID=UPI003D9041A4
MHATTRRHTVAAAAQAPSLGLQAGGCGHSRTGPAAINAATGQDLPPQPDSGTQPGPDGG